MQRISIAELGGLDHVRVSVSYQPMATVLSLVADTLGARAQGVPPQWRQALRRACPDNAPELLRPAFAPQALGVPDCLSPDPHDTGDVDSQLDRMMQTSPEELYADLVADFPSGVPRRWERVVDDPRAFITAYTRTLASIWTDFEPVWKRGRDLLLREAERIGTAAVTGTLDTALATLSPRVSLADGSLRLPDPCAMTVSLSGRRITLVPLVSGPSASVLNLDGADCIWIGYPVPGIGRLWGSGLPSPAARRNALEAVLGRVRAQLLRAAARPLTVGEASTLVGCVPSAVTHHCKRLEEAQLITRSRHGKHVIVRRTPTGDRLIDLLT